MKKVTSVIEDDLKMFSKEQNGEVPITVGRDATDGASGSEAD